MLIVYTEIRGKNWNVMIIWLMLCKGWDPVGTLLWIEGESKLVTTT